MSDFLLWLAMPFIFLWDIVLAICSPFVAIARAIEARRYTPEALEKKAREHTQLLYEAALAAQPKRLTDVELLRAVFGGATDEIPDNLLLCMANVADYLYETEHPPGGGIQPPPAVCNSIEGGEYRDFLSRATAHKDSKIITSIIAESFREIRNALPKFDGDDGLTVSIVTAIPDLGELVQSVIFPFFDDQVKEQGLFVELRRQLQHNLAQVSGNRAIFPSQYKGSDVVYAYLKGTPLLDLFQATVPFSFPDKVRFEHTHICAGTGHGKSQTIQYFLMRDFGKVVRGEASVIVIDSQRDLIDRISRLQLFGAELRDRIVIIDPEDIEHPVALSLFNMGLERAKTYSALDRERLQNSLIELLSFVLGTLLAAEMTAKQGTLFNYIIRAMLVIPNSTIYTLIDILQPNGYAKYKEYIAKLSPTAQLFFETEFQKDKQFADTKSQVLRRIYGILENTTFERMFAHPHSKLDLFAEMNAGKVILINTAKSLLQQSGTEIFGRFFIALLAQAAQERATLPESQRLPCYVYIDEAGDYLSNADAFVTGLFGQARKYKVGMCVAHQMLSDLSPKTADAIAANTSIKFVGGASQSDTAKLARELRVSPEFIDAQQKGSFAVYIRGKTKTALSLTIPFGVMEKAPHLSRSEYEAIRQLNRERYTIAAAKPPVPEAEPLPERVATLKPQQPPQEEAAAQEGDHAVIRPPAPKDTIRKRKVKKTAKVKVEEEQVDHMDTKPSPEW